MERKRMTAVKTNIEPIINGKFVKQEGFNPSYVITNMGKKLSRVRILGTVVYKFISDDKRFASITLDDSSNTIRVRVFKALTLIEDVKIGDIVDVIGKIREYNQEIYVIPEIIKKIDNPNLEILRELEIRKNQDLLKEKRKIILEYQKQAADMDELKVLLKENFNFDSEEVEAVLTSSIDNEEEKEQEDAKQKILKLIEKLDTGIGCNYEELIKTAGVQEDVLDAIINDLLTDGACFEPKPGVIKKL